jgi:UDP-glucose 4-epimerase
MKILITGGAGFIGSHIVDLLQARGHDVTIIDSSEANRKRNLESSDRVFMRDITEPLTDLGPFDVICHQAAQPSLRRSIDDPADDARVNIIGTINVIRAAREWGAHVVFASTSAVYAEFPEPHAETVSIGGVRVQVSGVYAEFPRLCIETDALQPTTPYGLAKLTAERYIELLAPSYTILRYGNVYGPRQVPLGENQMIPHCLAHLMNGQPFVINGDGEQTRDFVYVEDIARANVLAIEQQARGVFNCAVGCGFSVNTVCYMLATLTNSRSEYQYGSEKPGEARHVVLKSEQAKKSMGWRAETALADGLRQTVAWWQKHRFNLPKRDGSEHRSSSDVNASCMKQECL